MSHHEKDYRLIPVKQGWWRVPGFGGYGVGNDVGVFAYDIKAPNCGISTFPGLWYAALEN